MAADTIVIRRIRDQDYLSTWEAMQLFTAKRNEDTLDEIWLLEHNPVFTQGQNGKAEHVLNPGQIPVIKVDRGGQITYHGPGQCVVYTLIDLKRKKFTIRSLVNRLEHAVVQLLNEIHIKAESKPDAPGVYVDKEKICSVGLRVRRGCSYHGIALNVSMDLEPFSRINPCGFSQLKMTQISSFGDPHTVDEIGEKLIHYLMQNLGYTYALHETEYLYQRDKT